MSGEHANVQHFIGESDYFLKALSIFWVARCIWVSKKGVEETGREERVSWSDELKVGEGGERTAVELPSRD